MGMLTDILEELRQVEYHLGSRRWTDDDDDSFLDFVDKCTHFDFQICAEMTPLWDTDAQRQLKYVMDLLHAVEHKVQDTLSQQEAYDLAVNGER
jgi:hypothetical protein